MDTCRCTYALLVMTQTIRYIQCIITNNIQDYNNGKAKTKQETNPTSYVVKQTTHQALVIHNIGPLFLLIRQVLRELFDSAAIWYPPCRSRDIRNTPVVTVVQIT